jgi:hypothetical protein
MAATARTAAGRRTLRLAALALAVCGCAGVHAETFVDLGIGAMQVEAKVANIDAKLESSSTGLHFGVGARRRLAGGGDIGVRLELDDVDSNTLLAVRALDYRFNRSERLAFSVFLGAARLALATPAYGYYFGGGVQLKEIVRGWDLGIDGRIGDKVARDNLLPTDPQGGSPDNFYDLTGISVYLSRRF